MSNSKEKLQLSVLNVGEQFAASMDTLLDTELKYLTYLRNRKRFHIGVRNIISNGLGSGIIPPDDPKPTKTRRNPRRPNPTGVGVPIPVPIVLPEKVKEREEDITQPKPLLLPEKKPQNQDQGANDIKDFERQPVEQPVLQPQGELVPVSPTPELVNGGQTFDAPGDDIFNYQGLSDFFGRFSLPQLSLPQINIDPMQVLSGIGALLLLPLTGFGINPLSAKEQESSSNIFTQPTETIIGEDGAEVVVPVDELGDLIALIYKDGAEMFIGTTYDFLSGLPSSPGKTSVLGDANRLASIFNISDAGDGTSFSLGLQQPITFTSTSTEEEENIEEVIDTPVNSSGTKKEFDLESIEKTSLKEAVKSDGESRIAKRRKSKKSFEEIKAEIDAKELAKNQNKANKVSDGSQQVKIPSDGNGEDRFGNDIILNNSTELAWQKAVRAAALDGVDLASGVNSSFRTPDQQQQLLDMQDAGDPSVAQVAEIGTSPHQQGWGIDLALGSPAHQWMLQNGKKFNFDWAGTEDPVHFNFVNNESNTKHLENLQEETFYKIPESGHGDLIPVKNNLISKKTKAKIGATVGALSGLGMMSNNIVPPNIQNDKEIVSNEQVNQMDKNSNMIATQPSMIPVPIQTTVQVPVPMAKNETKEIKRTLIIDTFDKGSRVEVAYV